ncbi:MAG: EutN/CcmL family microcompartment protein [Clostridiales bacterium]|jgi:ethanolamine utilization protein EutN|nr:EutN/CcmL family microcompartment protein [Clostridiales bacterium]
MILARVVGNVVATQKNPNLNGYKLLLIQPIDLKGKPAGSELLAVDAVGSGIGDLVVAIAEGRSVRQILAPGSSSLPIDVVIAGIVDEVISTEGSLYLYD